MSGFGSNAKLTQTQCDNIKEELKDDIRETITDELTKKVGALDDKVTGIENRVDEIDDMALHKPSGWGDVAGFIKKGYAPLAFSTGEQLVTPWRYNGTTYDAPQNIVHFSESEEFSEDNGKNVTTGNGMVLQWHYTTPCVMLFDEKEALYVAPEDGLKAGVYYFTVTSLPSSWVASANNGKTFMFGLTDDLAEGQMLVLSAEYNNADWVGAYMRVYDSAYDTEFNTSYGAGGNMTLSVWDGESGEPLSGDTSANSTDGTGELNHIQRALLGYNRWSQSAIRQWLNSAAPARNANDPGNYPGWWKPQNKFDRIPPRAYTNPGFLAGYEADFIAAMKPAKVVTACNTVTDGGAADVTYDKVFLPSLTNMNIAQQAAEGYTWDYYKELFAANPADGRTNWVAGGTYEMLKSYDISTKTTAATVYLRSAYLGEVSYTWEIITTGRSYNNYAASYYYRVCPACVIG